MGCCPREGCGLHLTAGKGTATQGEVAVPVRDTGCIGSHINNGQAKAGKVAVPVRGTGCIDIITEYASREMTLLSP